MQLSAASGTVEISARSSSDPLPIPPGAHATRLAPLLQAAALVIRAIPDSSDAKIAGAINRFREATTFWSLTAPSEVAVVAYIIARTCPPVGTELPQCCQRPVQPQTVAGDIDALRRAAELNIDGMSLHSSALRAPMVSELLRAIGGRMKRLKTCKRALLFAEVEKQWTAAETIGTPNAIRDAFAVVLAFFFGMRVGEITSLMPTDIDHVLLSDKSDAMKITFRKVKNRQSLLQSHDPFVVSCGHPLLIRAWHRFEQIHDYFDDTPVFHATRGRTRDPLSRRWFADVIKGFSPSSVPHSARVGLATELWAAGASVEDIMAAGRWTSATAVMYVIGSLEGQVEATRKIGHGLSYDGNDLRRLGASPDKFPQRHRPLSTGWSAIARAVDRLVE